MPKSKPLITEIGSTRIYNSDAKIEGAEVNLIPDFESQVDSAFEGFIKDERVLKMIKRSVLAAHTSSLASQQKGKRFTGKYRGKIDARREPEIRAEEREKLKVWAEAYGGIKATGYSDYISRLDLLAYLSSLDKGE